MHISLRNLIFVIFTALLQYSKIISLNNIHFNYLLFFLKENTTTVMHNMCMYKLFFRIEILDNG